MNDEAARRTLSGRAFADMLAVVQEAGRMVDRFGDAVDDLDRAEWYRFVTRLMRNGFERFVENCEEDRPRLRDVPWRQSINFQSPDQDHFLAEFIDGSHDYLIRGNRGTVPYFVIGAWRATQPRHPGGRDWAPDGLEGLKSFDPAQLRTTGFLQSDTVHFDRDGNFEIVVSQKKPEDGRDWLPITADCVGLLVRTVYHLREETDPATFTLARLDGTPPRPVTPADVADGLAKTGQIVLSYAELVRSWWQDNLAQRPNHIRFSRAVYLSNGGVPDRHHGFGTWECAADEALVIEFVPIEADYWIFQLCNIWQENLDNYEEGDGYVQKYRARLLSDGRARIIICASDPGLPGNRIDPWGHRHGGMSLRFIKTESRPPAVHLWRVKVALLRDEGEGALRPENAIVSGEVTD